MEELQDAIEDAQYVNAISNTDEGPRPVLPWPVPSEEEMSEWRAAVLSGKVQRRRSFGLRDKLSTSMSESETETESSSRNDNGGGDGFNGGHEPFGFEWTLSQSLGLFLFSSYLKEVCRDYVQINFIEDVLRWKSMRAGGSHSRQRADKARRIIRSYLLPLGVDEDGRAKLPERTEIEEDDLAMNSELRLDEEEQAALVRENSDPSCSQCCVGLGGPLLEEMIDAVASGEKRSSSVRSSSTTARSPGSEGSALAAMISSAAHSEDGDRKEAVSAAAEAGGGSDENKDKNNASANPVTEDSTALDSPSSASENEGVGKGADEDEKEDISDPIAVAKTATVAPVATKRMSSPRVHLSEKKIRSLRKTYFDRAERIVSQLLKDKYWDSFLESEQHAKLMQFLWFQDKDVVEEDFFVMRVLGRGGFGLVNACKKGTSGKLYAMKVMNKKRIKIKKSEQLILHERSALQAVDSPFIVNLKYSFHSKDDVFLVLDLMTGGDLSFHLQQRGRFTKRECLYYAARIMLGLQALHDRNYVYRDLKPENCLMGEDGRVKLTDLGLTTRVTPTLHGAAGTRGYWAPEMLRRDKNGRRMPYGKSVDWFSFGCCLAEFISGTNPFRSEMALNFGLGRGNKKKEDAIDCATLEMEPVFDPIRFDSNAADICRRLLDKDETRRMGVNGCEEIMKHPWFREASWETIMTDRKRPPFVPARDVNAASQSQIGTFAEDKTYSETKLDKKDEMYYKDWDWTNPKAFAAEVIEFLIYERETGKPLLPMQGGGGCCCVLS